MNVVESLRRRWFWRRWFYGYGSPAAFVRCPVDPEHWRASNTHGDDEWKAEVLAEHMRKAHDAAPRWVVRG